MRKVTMLAVLAALAAGGCGGGGGTAASVTNFLGTWGYASGGAITLSCQGSAAQVSYLDGFSVSVTRDTSVAGGLIEQSDFDADFDPTGCARYLDAVGNTATMATAQNCSYRNYDSVFGYYTLTIAPYSQSLTYLGGRSMRETSTDTLRYAYDSGTYTDCTRTISGVTLLR